MDESSYKTISLKNLTDGQCLTLKGPAVFRIGLTADEKLIYVAADSENAEAIIVPLILVTVWKTAGISVAPANRDLPCLLNGKALLSEANLISGSVIEVGSKHLEFSDGPPPLPKRRCLPPTPGVPILAQPPPKPQRACIAFDEDPTTGMKAKPTRPLSVRRPPPLPSDWAIIELPNTDAELIKQTRTPEQLASLASSYVTKHIHLHTDARVTAELTDQIFSAMLEVAHHGRNILQRFLTDLIEEQSNSSADDDQPLEPSHGAVIILLREILRQFLDPETLVVVSLLMLRALSHVPGASQSLVECQVTSAILGTMAALKSAATVQQYCLDVLAKIALFQPKVTQKAPLRETAVDLVYMSLETHARNVTIAQGACRVLANLSMTLNSVINNTLDNYHSKDVELQKFVSGILSVLDYIFTKCLLAVQKAVTSHSHDLTIKTDGRRFLFIYAKLEQLRQRKDQWLTTPFSPVEPPPIPARSQEAQPSEQDSDEDPDCPSRGIMKRSRSFENLRTPERKVTFDEEDDSSSSPSPTVEQQNSNWKQDHIEVLAQRVIEDPRLMESSPETPTDMNDEIDQQPPDSTQYMIGNRPDTEGSDMPYNSDIEYENWDLLRGVLRKKSSLKDHLFSTSDLKFMARLTKTQVVALLCALAVDDKMREALRLIDQPISEMLRTSEVPPGVRDFVAQHYSASDTLMELDPGLMVSIIDAVRYNYCVSEYSSTVRTTYIDIGFIDISLDRSLSLEMAQKSVLGVVHALDEEQKAPVVAVTVEFLASAITNRPLAPAMTVPSFVNEVCTQLERAKKISQNADALDSLLAEIKLCIKKKSTQ